MSKDTKDSLLDALLIRYVKERTETEQSTPTLSSKATIPMLWLQFHGQAFAFRKDELLQIPYIAVRLARWDGKLGLGTHKDSPLPMTLMSLDRFLRAYNYIVHRLSIDVDYRDDLLALGINDSDVRSQCTSTTTQGIIKISQASFNTTLTYNCKQCGL